MTVIISVRTLCCPQWPWPCSPLRPVLSIVDREKRRQSYLDKPELLGKSLYAPWTRVPRSHSLLKTRSCWRCYREVGEKLSMHFKELQYSTEHTMPLQHRMKIEWGAASCASETSEKIVQQKWQWQKQRASRERKSGKRFSAPNFKNALHRHDARFVYERQLINPQWVPLLKLMWWGKHRLKLQKALKATWMGCGGADANAFAYLDIWGIPPIMDC